MSATSHHEGVVKALIAGIVANLAIGVAKFVAFLFSGSAAMLAEALHSVADSSNQGLLALGLKRSQRLPTETHPFGFAKERYFWSFLVALIIFALGAVFAIYEGVHKISHPTPIQNPGWVYFALAVGIVFESFALRVAWREFREFRETNPGSLLEGLRATKDPTLPTVLFEDSAAIVGLLVALVGVTVTVVTGDATYDGVASIIIGLVLLGVSWFLAVESFSLLVGEAALPVEQSAIREVAESDPAVVSVLELLTLQRGPDSLLVALTLEFADDLVTGQIETAVCRLESAIKARIPTATHIFIETGSISSRSPEDA
ncbi:MAG: cation diffusion facilitator family transporter [Planctomycetota bacterium]